MSSSHNPFNWQDNATSGIFHATSPTSVSAISANDNYMRTSSMGDTLRAQIENDQRILAAVNSSLTSTRLRLAASRTDSTRCTQTVQSAEKVFKSASQAGIYLDRIEAILNRSGRQTGFGTQPREDMGQSPQESIQEVTELRNTLGGLQGAKRYLLDEARANAKEADAVVLANTNEVSRLECIINSLHDSISSKQYLIDAL
jgi:hypothetical protein